MALNTTVYEKFRNAFEQKCFRLIIEAYENSLAEKVIQLAMSIFLKLKI